MPYRNDKVSDVMAVLTIIKEKFRKRTSPRNSVDLRKEAIHEFAESELSVGRYKNERSAVETLRDACTRRLRPDIRGIRIFDCYVHEWLYQDSMTLQEILLRHSKYQPQRIEISHFFEGEN